MYPKNNMTTQEGIFTISVRNKKIKIQINDKMFLDYVNRLTIQPNNKMYQNKLEAIINFCVTTSKYIFIEREHKYIFQFDVEIFNDVLEIHVDKNKFFTHEASMEKLLELDDTVTTEEKSDDFYFYVFSQPIKSTILYHDILFDVNKLQNKTHRDELFFNSYYWFYSYDVIMMHLVFADITNSILDALIPVSVNGMWISRVLCINAPQKKTKKRRLLIKNKTLSFTCEHFTPNFTGKEETKILDKIVQNLELKHINTMDTNMFQFFCCLKRVS